MEQAVLELARHLAQAGARTLLMTRPATREAAFPGEVVYVPYASLPAGRHGRVLDRALNYPGFATRLGRAVAERVAAGTIDAVYAQGLTGLGYARLRARDRALKAPLVMNPQGMEEHKTHGLKRLALLRLRRLSREAARRSDRVIATDLATRAEVLELLGVAPDRVEVIPNGIDIERARALTPDRPRAYVASALPALQDASPLLLSVGRLEEYKGLDDTLRALVRLRQGAGLPPGWAWAIVGEGPHRRAFARAAAAAGLLAGGYDSHALGAPPARSDAARIHLLGRVDDALLHALYERADWLVHATHYEGSSLVTLEAMAHALPVVAARAGGLPDKVVPGETGYLAEPRDAASLAEALGSAFRTQHPRETLGQRGLEHARQFSWPEIARRTLSLFDELLRAPRA
jgi:glycosyltransferase involved in cell wall biosynthesis